MTIKRRIVIWYTIWMALLVAAASLLLILGSGVLLRHEAAAELEERVYDMKMNIFPIEQSEMDRNKSMVQNPGW